MEPSHQQYGSKKPSGNDLTENTIILNSRDQRQPLSGLSLILLVAFLLRLYVAVSFPNINHPDEVFQYIEQAQVLERTQRVLVSSGRRVQTSTGFRDERSLSTSGLVTAVLAMYLLCGDRCGMGQFGSQ